MSKKHSSVDDFRELSEKYGKDHLLIQGAGGNTSYKHRRRMSIKASGKWLADSRSEDIFVDVDFKKIRELIALDSENPLQGVVVDQSSLKPSIETTLHAILPHKIVVHTHSVDIISLAVTTDAKEKFLTLLRGLEWDGLNMLNRV